jgi:hypothetical protein
VTLFVDIVPFETRDKPLVILPGAKHVLAQTNPISQLEVIHCGRRLDEIHAAEHLLSLALAAELKRFVPGHVVKVPLPSLRPIGVPLKSEFSHAGGSVTHVAPLVFYN